MPETSSPTGHVPAPASSPLHDVLIVGGGLVGSSLAIALDRLGLDVGLLEASPPGGLPPVFDERNLSFAEATVNALTALGVMQKLRTPTGAIQRIHVSRQGDFGRVLLDARQYQRAAFGQVVVARDFGEALEARLLQLKRLNRYRPARFVGLGEAGDGQGRDGRRDRVEARAAARRGADAGDADDGAGDDGAILEFDGDLITVEFLEEFY